MSQAQSKRFEAFKEQDRFLWADKRYMGYISGVGAGKTFAGIIRTYLNMQQWNPGEMGAIIAPTRQMVVNVIIPEMREMGLIGENCVWTYKSAYSDEPGIHSKNGSRALILSADNTKAIERLRGLNLAWVWLDEEAVIDPRAREIAMQRLRTGEYRNLYITTTPKGKNHTYDFFVGNVETQKSQYGEATLFEASDRVAIVGVPTSANPHTPQDYKDAMEQDLPEALRAQEVQGQFVEIGSGVLTKDMLSATSIDTVLDNTELSFHIGVDLGVEPNPEKARSNDSDYWAAAVVGVHRRKGKAYVIDVSRKRGMSLSQGVEWLKTVQQGVPKPSIKIENVHAQQYFLSACKDANLPVSGISQNLKKEDRLIQLSVPFENDKVQLCNYEQTDSNEPEGRWNQFIQEWIAFPDGSHDDLLDAVEIALRNVSLGGELTGVSGKMYGEDDG